MAALPAAADRLYPRPRHHQLLAPHRALAGMLSTIESARQPSLRDERGWSCAAYPSKAEASRPAARICVSRDEGCQILDVRRMPRCAEIGPSRARPNTSCSRNVGHRDLAETKLGVRAAGSAPDGTCVGAPADFGRMPDAWRLAGFARRSPSREGLGTPPRDPSQGSHFNGARESHGRVCAAVDSRCRRGRPGASPRSRAPLSPISLSIPPASVTPSQPGISCPS